jgi:Asp-tRNA(Asn)/Glu-tRNA(Gln) amidotransferase A subunit family amidase
MFNRWGSGSSSRASNLRASPDRSDLPVGIQLMGAMGDDLAVLRAAKWIACACRGTAADNT